MPQVLVGTLGVLKSRHYYTDDDDLDLAHDGSWTLNPKVPCGCVGVTA